MKFPLTVLLVVIAVAPQLAEATHPIEIFRNVTLVKLDCSKAGSAVVSFTVPRPPQPPFPVELPIADDLCADLTMTAQPLLHLYAQNRRVVGAALHNEFSAGSPYGILSFSDECGRTMAPAVATPAADSDDATGERSN